MTLKRVLKFRVHLPYWDYSRIWFRVHLPYWDYSRIWYVDPILWFIWPFRKIRTWVLSDKETELLPTAEAA